MVSNIRKRDGRIKPFDQSKIKSAVLAAMKKCGTEDEGIATKIAHDISNINRDVLDVEEVQDLVEIALMNSEYKNVAKEYITYREQRTRIRKSNDSMNVKIAKVISCTDVQNANANVDERSFAGRKNESANILFKELALSSYMNEAVANAHKNHELYSHDLSEYVIGTHNCLFADMKLLHTGFSTRNGNVRGAGRFSTACQQIAVIFQIQSQEQFGGVATQHIDFDLRPFVKKSFAKHYADGMKWLEGGVVSGELLTQMKEYSIDNEFYTDNPKVYHYAMTKLHEEMKEGCQALYHNLNTLESRAGSQVPFSSINFGRDMSLEGQLVTRHMLEASIDGIGSHHETPIFPISIFKYKKGVNDKPGTPGYELKLLAIKSLSKRIYPNIVNCDWSMNVEDENNPDTHMATMGCRTLIGYDRHGYGYSKRGRGNCIPVTINLVDLGIKHGIVLGQKSANITGFWAAFEDMLKLAEKALKDRFYYVASQSNSSAKFMYNNGTAVDTDKATATSVYETMKHFTLAIGFIGVAEMCQALFGKDHVDSSEVHMFALSVVKRIHDFAKEASDRNNLNFGCYATPAENVCRTLAKGLRDKYGIIPNVTDREYITNSFHVPVWKEVSIFEKLKIEAPFTKYPTAGCITYVELEANIMNNLKAIEDIIDFAMGLDIPYLAFNFPIDTCDNCGYQGEIETNCPVCSGASIKRLRRVTGYLTTDYRNFNVGKIKECLDRVKHSKFTDLRCTSVE